MKKYLLLVSAVIFIASSVSAQGNGSKNYIVVFKDDVEDVQSSTEDLKRGRGLEVAHVYGHALKGFAGTIPAHELTSLKNDPRVAFISEDGEVSIQKVPSATPGQQILPTGINRINAENKANKGAGVNVAVIDTGIDLDHPDLVANIVGGKNCQTGTSYDDGNGHGTHVAGTIAARNNTIGVVGVAPEAKLWAVRVLNNSGTGTWSSIICGIDFVTSKAPANGGPITLANMSLGGAGASDNNCGNSNNDALHRAICRSRDAGVTYVVAAGNNNGNASASVPAAYNDAVITVSALADYDGASGNDTFASFSNYGSVVDIAAPGVNIRSTWKGGGYATISGTSMATPHITGSAALYLATHPGSSWIVIRDALKTLGEQLGNGHTDPTGLHPEEVVRVDTL